MKKFMCILTLVAMSMATGCTGVSSTLAEDHHNHWLVKNKGLVPGFALLTWSSEVYYCPKDGGQCQVAEIEE